MHTPHKRLLPEPSWIPQCHYALGAPRLPESKDPSRPGRVRSPPQDPVVGFAGPCPGFRWVCTKVPSNSAWVRVPPCGTGDSPTSGLPGASNYSIEVPLPS